MKTTDISALFRNSAVYGGKDIAVNGWVRTNRASGKFGFLEITDGSCFRGLQIVYEEKFLDNFSEISSLTAGCAVSAEGRLELTLESRQPFELKASSVKVEALADSSYPLQKKRHSMEFLREIAHLRPRSNTFSAVFRVRSLAAAAIHSFFQERGFVYVNTPLLTGSDAEGAGEMFQVTALDPLKGAEDYSGDFFGRKASLSVSGQLEAEAFALAFGKVYTFGPAFRAEDSNTARHAAEFWMIEPEIAFADLKDDMDLAEDMTKYVIKYVMDKAPDEYEFFEKRISKGIIDKLNKAASTDFARIPYTDAIEILQRSGEDFKFPVSWGIDLQTEHERYISEKYVGGPVFITDYPKDIKAFYMRMNEDGKTVAAADMLVPGIGELVGGSQREERYDVLVSRMKELGMDMEPYDWYLDLRKYGGVKHAGFGIGFERLIMYLTGMSNIRDVIPFPRTPGNLEF
ncbi:MAG: asparagine--tRNA ligase [Anaerovoracaceae bacterium]|nr:asparagine--tRNA ligase [Bacillota bacterium]MDY2670635.1 asparagine--tRNA ligase [Anaerovoracaceae bacterium]